jgi:hypothetical protein
MARQKKSTYREQEFLYLLAKAIRDYLTFTETSGLPRGKDCALDIKGIANCMRLFGGSPNFLHRLADQLDGTGKPPNSDDVDLVDAYYDVRVKNWRSKTRRLPTFRKVYAAFHARLVTRDPDAELPTEYSVRRSLKRLGFKISPDKLGRTPGAKNLDWVGAKNLLAPKR